MRPADVCLVSKPGLGRAKSTIVPHWILWLAGHLESRGFGVDVVDVKSPVHAPGTPREAARLLAETLARVAASRAPVVGLSGYTGDFSALMGLAREIKRRRDVKIVVGGIHATIAPEDYFRDPGGPFDAAVVGDGEAPLAAIASSVRDRSGGWDRIPGIVYRDGGELVRTPETAVHPALDEMPPLPYHKLDMEFYLQPQQFLVRSVYLSGVHIFTARGCPYRCTFCANAGKRVRYRPIASVIAEIANLKSTWDIDGFYIHDDTFTIRSARVLEFCEQLEELKETFAWGMEGRVNQVPDEVIPALRRSGCIQIDFGVESGSQDVLDRMRKGIRVEETLAAFRRCRAAGIRTYANFLLNTPGETAADLERTARLMAAVRATTYGICLVTPYPGTTIYEQHVRPPLEIAEYALYEDDRSYVSIVDPRFRLAAHDLDLEAELRKLAQRYMLRRNWRILSRNPRYLRVLLGSSRRGLYISVLWSRVVRRVRNLLRRVFGGEDALVGRAA